VYWIEAPLGASRSNVRSSLDQLLRGLSAVSASASLSCGDFRLTPARPTDGVATSRGIASDNRTSAVRLLFLPNHRRWCHDEKNGIHLQRAQQRDVAGPSFVSQTPCAHSTDRHPSIVTVSVLSPEHETPRRNTAAGASQRIPHDELRGEYLKKSRKTSLRAKPCSLGAASRLHIAAISGGLMARRGLQPQVEALGENPQR